MIVLELLGTKKKEKKKKKKNTKCGVKKMEGEKYS